MNRLCRGRLSGIQTHGIDGLRVGYVKTASLSRKDRKDWGCRNPCPTHALRNHLQIPSYPSCPILGGFVAFCSGLVSIDVVCAKGAGCTVYND